MLEQVKDRHVRAAEVEAKQLMRAAGLSEPPGCIWSHDPADCEMCDDWQNAAHEALLESGIARDGALTPFGELLHRQSRSCWPLRPETNARMEVATRARPPGDAPVAGTCR